MYYPLTVVKVTKETPNSVSVILEAKPEVLSSFSFEAGQFLTIKKTINGQEVVRSYSLCSTPKSGKLMIAIKHVQGGIFSTYAINDLKEGDELEVAVPAGKFTIIPQPNNQNNYFFFAAGSGITPVWGMIKTLLSEEPLSKVYLFYGNKDEEHTIFKKEIDQSNDLHENFTVNYFYSLKKDGAFNSGRISTNKLGSISTNILNPKEVHSFYFCGPEGMINELSNSLKQDFGIDESKLNFELFYTEQPNSVSEGKKGEVIVAINGEFHTLKLEENETIIDASEKVDLDLPYSCRGGICGACECKVQEGEFEMQNNFALSDPEVAEGKLLACQAVLKSEQGKIYFT